MLLPSHSACPSHSILTQKNTAISTLAMLGVLHIIALNQLPASNNGLYLNNAWSYPGAHKAG